MNAFDVVGKLFVTSMVIGTLGHLFLTVLVEHPVWPKVFAYIGSIGGLLCCLLLLIEMWLS